MNDDTHSLGPSEEPAGDVGGVNPAADVDLSEELADRLIDRNSYEKETL